MKKNFWLTSDFMLNEHLAFIDHISFLPQIHCQEAVLHVSDGSTDKEYCLVYNSTWSNLSVDLSTAVSPPVIRRLTFTVWGQDRALCWGGWTLRLYKIYDCLVLRWAHCYYLIHHQMQYPLVNLTSSLLCNGAGLNPVEMKGKVLVVMRGECVFTQKALIAQDLGAAGLLIASTENMVGNIWVPRLQ